MGGAYVDVVNNAANSVKHATEVEDKRLGALVAIKGYKDADKAIKNIKSNGGGKVTENLSINVSLGTTKSKSESNSTTTVANASEVKAGGDVNVTSTKKDIDITGSNVEGKDVTLNAKENLNIIASENTNNTEQSSKSSSASVGASIGIDGTKYSVSGSMSKGEVSANGTTYNESTVTANKDLSFASGNDTNIKGGMLSSEKVTGNVGGDLNIESKQDSNSYKETNKSVGVSIGLGSNKAVSGSASIGKIDSKYKSVTDQSGIYAGTEGFDINLGENTDLKGGIIFSEAEKDKNKISTGTLTFEDIRNKADYKAGGAGIKVNKNNDADYNEKGITPDIGMPASGEAESTTKATISKGTIEIRDKENQKQDINKLNRDTQNSLNKLGEIFGKTKIEERQELANLFGELAYNEIHYMDGSNEQKALYHAVVGGIMSKLTGGDFLAGATAAGINKLVIEEIVKVADGDPDKAQWVSAVLGAVISDLVSGNTQAGASVAASATKYNRFEDVYGTFDLKKLGVSNRQIVTVYLSEIQYALSHCDVYNAGTEQEIIKLDFGNGDYLDIKFGHGYRDDHKSQSRGIVPPFSSTDRKHVLSALISAAIIGYAEHKYNNTQYPVFGRGRPEYLSCNMYLYNPKTLRNELTKIEFSIGRKANGRIEISDFYPIAVIGGR